jgi:hypothetical protein
MSAEHCVESREVADQIVATGESSTARPEVGDFQGLQEDPCTFYHPENLEGRSRPPPEIFIRRTLRSERNCFNPRNESSSCHIFTAKQLVSLSMDDIILEALMDNEYNQPSNLSLLLNGDVAT